MGLALRFIAAHFCDSGFACNAKNRQCANRLRDVAPDAPSRRIIKAKAVAFAPMTPIATFRCDLAKAGRNGAMNFGVGRVRERNTDTGVCARGGGVISYR
jgi:hypothetical protein